MQPCTERTGPAQSGGPASGAWVPDWLLSIREIPPGAKLVYAALARYCDETTGCASPTLATLAAGTGMSVRAVQHYLAALERAGLVERVQVGRGRSRPNSYRLRPENTQGLHVLGAENTQELRVLGAENAQGLRVFETQNTQGLRVLGAENAQDSRVLAVRYSSTSKLLQSCKSSFSAESPLSAESLPGREKEKDCCYAAAQPENLPGCAAAAPPVQPSGSPAQLSLLQAPPQANGHASAHVNGHKARKPRPDSDPRINQLREVLDREYRRHGLLLPWSYERDGAQAKRLLQWLDRGQVQDPMDVVARAVRKYLRGDQRAAEHGYPVEWFWARADRYVNLVLARLFRDRQHFTS